MKKNCLLMFVACMVLCSTAWADFVLKPTINIFKEPANSAKYVELYLSLDNSSDQPVKLNLDDATVVFTSLRTGETKTFSSTGTMPGSFPSFTVAPHSLQLLPHTFNSAWYSSAPITIQIGGKGLKPNERYSINVRMKLTDTGKYIYYSTYFYTYSDLKRIQ
ncbi:MAG: hypothetical protein HQL26_03635 [Candidatus Omnitrophica bacterium]|nr:hypothetical protein [Candidatus Omnitrophota bacterium]